MSRRKPAATRPNIAKLCRALRALDTTTRTQAEAFADLCLEFGGTVTDGGVGVSVALHGLGGEGSSEASAVRDWVTNARSSIFAADRAKAANEGLTQDEVAL